MNDPRESLGWSFGSINLPYEEIFKGYYSDQTHINSQYRLGKIIKDKYQVLCFSGVKGQGWNNEMMWAHYGGMHSGVCLEFDEDILMDNLSTKFPDADSLIDNINYSNLGERPWINWQPSKSQEENLSEIQVDLVKEMVLSKSVYWEKEDERRLACINSNTQLSIPIHDALKTVHLGVSFNKNGKEMVEAVFSVLAGRCKLSIMIYQHNRFERWGMRLDSFGKLKSCEYEDLI